MHSQSSLDMSASVAELWAEKRTAQMPLVGQPSRCHIYIYICHHIYDYIHMRYDL